MVDGDTSRTSQVMNPAICSRYSVLALSRVTQKVLSMLGGTMMVRSLPTMPAMTPSDSNWHSERTIWQRRANC